jgi:hypothetical protein
VRPGVSLKYISDMVSIDHSRSVGGSDSEPVSLSTEDAYFLTFQLELLL